MKFYHYILKNKFSSFEKYSIINLIRISFTRKRDYQLIVATCLQTKILQLIIVMNNFIIFIMMHSYYITVKQ